MLFLVNKIVLLLVNNILLHSVNNVANKVAHPWNNVITVLFNYQYCCYFLTGLNNNVMITIANKLVLLISFSVVLTTVNNCLCFINAEQLCWNYNEQHCPFNNIVSLLLFVELCSLLIYHYNLSELYMFVIPISNPTQEGS